MPRKLLPFNRKEYEDGGGQVEWTHGQKEVVVQNKGKKIQVLHVVITKEDGSVDYEKAMLASQGGPLVLLIDYKGRFGLIQKWQPQSRNPYNWFDGFPLITYSEHGRISYELPGGMIDEDHSLDDAARREVEDETGISIPFQTLIPGFVELCACPNLILNFDFYMVIRLPKGVKSERGCEKEGILEPMKFFTRKQIAKLVDSGDLYDARTLAALAAYWLQNPKKFK